jgi:hypothetical protein
MGAGNSLDQWRAAIGGFGCSGGGSSRIRFSLSPILLYVFLTTISALLAECAFTFGCDAVYQDISSLSSAFVAQVHDIPWHSIGVGVDGFITSVFMLYPFIFPAIAAIQFTSVMINSFVEYITMVSPRLSTLNRRREFSFSTRLLCFLFIPSTKSSMSCDDADMIVDMPQQYGSIIVYAIIALILVCIALWKGFMSIPRIAFAAELDDVVEGVLKDLCGRKRTKQAAQKLYKDFKNHENVEGVRAAISDMLKLLIKYHINPTQDQMFQSKVHAAKENLAAEMKKVSDGRWEDKINLSELLSTTTLGVVLKNYAPNDDCAEQGKDTHNRIPRKNSCVLTYAKVIINSLLKEAGSTSDSLGDGSLNSIRFVDVCALALGKDKYEEEIKEFCKAADISVDEFYLIGSILVGFHALFYKMNNPGMQMPFMVASANARDHVINTNASPNENGIIITNLLMYCGVVPHGECWVNKAYLLNWDEDDYVPFANSLVWFYSSFYVDIGRLKDKEGGSEILLRFSGLISMTPAERKEIRDCRRANQEMMVLAAAMHRVGWKREMLTVESEVAMYDRLFARKGKGDHANFLLLLQKRFSHCRATMLAVALYKVGWDPSKLSAQSEKELYQELLESKTENDNHEELLKLLKKKSAGCLKMILAAAMARVGWDHSLLTDQDEIGLYHYWLEEFANNDPDELCEILKVRYESSVVTGEIMKLAAAMSRVGWVVADLTGQDMIDMYNRLKERKEYDDDARFIKLLKRRFMNAEIMKLAAAMSRAGWVLTELTTQDDIEMYNRLKKSKEYDDDDAGFIKLLQDRYESAEIMKLAAAMSRAGWVVANLTTQDDINMYHRLKKSKEYDDNDAGFIELLQDKYNNIPMVKFNSALGAVFVGEDMADDFSDEMMAMFGHVIDSIAAFAKLEGDGSNAQEVYVKVIRILTDNVEGAYDVDGVLSWGRAGSTFVKRWKALKKRCIANGDETKFNLLEQEKTAAIGRDTQKRVGTIGTFDSAKKKMKRFTPSFTNFFK